MNGRQARDDEVLHAQTHTQTGAQRSLLLSPSAETQALLHQPATDDRARAPDATEEVYLDGFAPGQEVSHTVLDGVHPGSIGYAHIRDGKAPLLD